ncbi:MAG TPA: MBL fold metallo-hydrolase [Acidimicrobiales bacterium]|nr:MBL fold metallo-hydrolase [Acidimicrobiales bacterium]
MRPTPELHDPYPIAPDTWVIPETLPAAPGTVVPVNSMVVTGAQPVIVDTGNELSREDWMNAAFSLVDPTDVRWVFLSHDDHDHVGNLLPVLDACPNATLVTNWFTVERLQRAIPLPLHRCRWLNDGDTFDAGDRTFVVKVPPVWDSPTTRGLYDSKTGVYWAVDAFACLLPGHLTDTGDIPPELWRESFLFSNRVGAPWHALLDLNKFDRHVDQVAALGMTTVASAHATTLRGPELEEAFRLIRQVARMDAAPLPGQAELDAILAVDQLQVA